MRLSRGFVEMLDHPLSHTSSTSAALEHVRQLVARCRESCEELVESAPTRPIRAVGIAGAGIMGAAIARQHAAHGFPVVLYDNDAEALRRAASVCNTGLSRSGGGISAEAGTARSPALIRFTLSPDDLAGCDLVLESIAEKLPVKQALYRQLSRSLDADGVLATNTSTIPITRLASALAAPTRFCGLHFCHPVGLRPLVEIIPGSATSPETIATLIRHSVSLGKLPLVVRDAPGFVVNRLLMAYLNAALDLMTCRVSPNEIDAAMVSFGMTLGPLALLDEIGLDTALQSGVVLSEVATQRSVGTELLVALVKAKQLGLKTGAGIYSYPARIASPTLEAFVDSPRGHPEIEASQSGDTSLVMRLLRPMVEEAQRLLHENKLSASWHIDLATIFGLGFPAWRGGLLWWAETMR